MFVSRSRRKLEEWLSELSPGQRYIYEKYTIRDRRHQVHFRSGDQTFTVNYPCKSRSQADWHRIQLAKALYNFVLAEKNVRDKDMKYRIVDRAGNEYSSLDTVPPDTEVAIYPIWKNTDV